MRQNIGDAILMKYISDMIILILNLLWQETINVTFIKMTILGPIKNTNTLAVYDILNFVQVEILSY